MSRVLVILLLSCLASYLVSCDSHKVAPSEAEQADAPPQPAQVELERRKPQPAQVESVGRGPQLDPFKLETLSSDGDDYFTGPKDRSKSVDVIESEVSDHESDVPVNFLRSDPAWGFSIIDVETITLYFDNRPRDVKITEAAAEVRQVIVKGNTVEISLTQPIFVPDIGFTVTWTGGKRTLTYFNNPDDAVGEFLKARPAKGGSIVGVDTVRVYVGGVALHAKCYNHTSESFIEGVTTFNFFNTIDIPIPHPIKEPSIRLTVSWTSRDKTAEKSKTLTYTNVVSEE